MRVLFCTTGGLGHLLPLRPLARALAGQGHAVAWATAPDALPLMDGTGFERFAAGPGFEASRHQFRSSHADAARLSGERLSAYTFPRLFGAVLAPAMLDDLDGAVRRWRPDLVVHEPAALAAPLVCRQQGLRHVTHGYGLRPPGSYLDDAMRFFGTHWRDRGLPVPADGGLYQHLELDIAPASLQPLPGSAAHRIHRFNPHPAGQAGVDALPAAIRTTLQAGAAGGPRIYVSFGTVFNRSPALIAAARAAARIGAAVVVTVGADGDPAPLMSLGPHVSVHRFVDQAALLAQADLVVSHGGAGTLLGAAAHGVVQLILPQAADHFRNARALSSVNAGRVIAPDQQTEDMVCAVMAETLKDGQLRVGAAALAREMSALLGPAETASWLQRWHACGAGASD